jgi:Ribbon-helix-helix protein, copG family
MNTLTIKLPEDLDTELQLASQRNKVSKSELVRRAIAAYIGPTGAQGQPASALSLAADLVGCFSGGPGDLATNPKYMDDFGRS